MTEVELLRTFQISPDGLRIETWPKGSTRHVDDATLAILIDAGACAIVERKAYQAAPENKGKTIKAESTITLSDTDPSGNKIYLKPKAKRGRGRPRKDKA